MNPSHEEIERRAYQLWEQRGRPVGSPQEDWFRAERELRAEPENMLAKVAREIGTAVGSAVARLSDHEPISHWRHKHRLSSSTPSD